MKFYTVSNEYISFLKEIDVSVPDNYQGRRPYIGVVLLVNGVKYLAPLTSYKEKQDSIKDSSPSVLKIYERSNPSNKLGMVQLNNMIPVLDEVISLLDIGSLEEKYKNLVYMQFEFLKLNREKLEKKAAKIYRMVVVQKTKHFVNISCNFSLLEEASQKFIK